METIFLPIKPTYAKRIVAGEKLYEFRKRIPRKNVGNIIIYASSPVKKVIGIATVEKVLAHTIDELWDLCKHACGITKNDYYSYFAHSDVGFAFSFSAIFKFREAISVSSLDSNFTIPQSFRYVDEHFEHTLRSLSLLPVFPAP